jgi:hypothetical protein
MAPQSTQPLTEMSTRNLPGGKKWPVHRTDNLAAICEPNVWKNVGASTSRNPKGLHGLYRDNFTFYWGKIQKPSINIAAEFQMKHFLNMSLEHYCYACPVSSILIHDSLAWKGPTVLCISWPLNKLLTDHCNGIALRILCPIWLFVLDVDCLLASALACALL